MELNYPYAVGGRDIFELKARHVEYVSGYPGLREPFIALFNSAFIPESARFMLAVADYKKNPTWDKCMSIYHLYIRPEKPGNNVDEVQPGDPRIKVQTQARVNIAGSVVRDIESKMSTRRGQVGGLGDRDIFDEPFGIVLNLSNNHSPGFKEKLSNFIKGYGIEVLSEANFTRFPQLADV